MNKRPILTKILAFAAAVLLLAVPVTAYATGLSVTADSTAVKAGDTVTVTINVTGERLAVVTGAFSYDPAILSYASSSGGASDGHINLVSGTKGGASSLTAVIKFKAIGAGEAVIDVSLESVLDYGGQALENADARVSISVSANGVPAEPGENTTAPPPDISLTGVAARNVMGAKGDMYVWRSLGSLTLPSGFYDRQVEYGGEFVGGATIPDSDDIILLYLSDKTGGNAGYYIYDMQRDMLYPYLTIMSVLKNFTLIWPDDAADVPEGYEETTLLWKETEVPAWKRKGMDEPVYLVYARDSSGEKALYLYNAQDESMQRFIAASNVVPEPEKEEPAAAPSAKPVSAPESEKREGYITIEETLFYAVCGAGAFLLVLSIVLLAICVKKGAGGKKADEPAHADAENGAEANGAGKEAVDNKAEEKTTADKTAREEKAKDKSAREKRSKDKKNVDKKDSDKKRKDKKEKKTGPKASDDDKKVIYVRDAKL